MAQGILTSSEEFYYTTLSALNDIHEMFIFINNKSINESEKAKLYDLSYDYIQYVKSALRIIKIHSEIDQSKHITLALTELIIKEMDSLGDSSLPENVDEILERVDRIVLLYTTFLAILNYYPFSDPASWYPNLE